MPSVGTTQQKLAVSRWPEWQFFNAVDALLADAISAVQEAEAERSGMLFPFLDAVQESASSLRMLVVQLKLRDSYVIARVIYETAINGCFLLTDPIPLSARANVHAKQKALRNLVRRIEIAGTSLFEFMPDGVDKVMQEPMHKEWLDEFTSKSGREVTAWTPETVQQRLEVIHLKFGPDATRGLAFGILLYRHASEIAHGTLYGTLFSWGAMEPGRPLGAASDLGVFRREELRHLLKLVCFSLESLVRVISVALNISQLGDSAREARETYYKTRNQDA